MNTLKNARNLRASKCSKYLFFCIDAAKKQIASSNFKKLPHGNSYLTNTDTIMYRNALLSLLLILILGLACEENSIDPTTNFPDFSNCNCDFEQADISCTADGRWFRSPCFAECIGVNVDLLEADSCDATQFDPNDYLSWPISFICHPILPPPPVVLNLSDSTKIF